MDRTAIEQYGIFEELLMENAGQAAYFVLLNEFGIKGRRFVVFCGLGNNGGDGFVVARKIRSSGGMVKVFVLGDPVRFKGAAKANFDIVSRLSIEVRPLQSVESAERDVSHCDCIVDAILGTGLTRSVGDLYRDAIQSINRSGRMVISVDIPSGVHGDTGMVMGTAVRAHYTVTFGLPKLGNVLFPGSELGGRLYASHISFPPSMIASESLMVEINRPLQRPHKGKVAREGHFGQVLVVADAVSRHGPPHLAAQSFLRGGGGSPCLAGSRLVTWLMANRGGEIVLLSQDETDSWTIPGLSVERKV